MPNKETDELIVKNLRNIMGVIIQIKGYPHGFIGNEVETILGFSIKDLETFFQKLNDFSGQDDQKFNYFSDSDFKLTLRLLGFGLIVIDTWESETLIDIKKSELVEVYKSFVLLEEELS